MSTHPSLPPSVSDRTGLEHIHRVDRCLPWSPATNRRKILETPLVPAVLSPDGEAGNGVPVADPDA